MTLKRLVLIGLTAIAALFLITDLVSSFSKPQFQSRLALYELDLRLHLSALQNPKSESSGIDQQLAKMVQESGSPVKAALTEYAKSRKQVQSTLTTLEPKIQAAQAIATPNSPLKPATELATLQAEAQTQQKNLEELTLRLGLLQVTDAQTEAAQQSWTELTTNGQSSSATRQAATVLNGLWNDPPRILADAEPTLKSTLDGWYQYRALDRLYNLQDRTAESLELQQQERKTAETVITTLGVTGLTTTAALITGVILGLTTLGQWAWKKEEAWLGNLNAMRWEVKWDWEDTWLVMVAGFFLVGQLIVGIAVAPLLRLVLGTLQTQFAFTDDIYKGLAVLTSYGALAAGSLGVLYLTIKPHLPLPNNWFRISLKGPWLSWGLGGYLVAFPLVLSVSILNSQIWQGQGGSNPLLPLVLEGRSPIALGLFLVTTAIAAPLFEEILFRGFLLPSLTRYLTPWKAVLLSAVIFAVVHLSLAEMIPLTVLGIMLGIVYTRTQNLLASILLHSLWNGGTILSLYLLGSANR